MWDTGSQARTVSVPPVSACGLLKMKMIRLVAIGWIILACGGCGKQASKEEVERRATSVCAGHLNAFVFAKKRWAQDHNAAPTDTPTFDDLDPYFRRGMRGCPDGGTYTIGTLSEPPQCSIAAHTEYFNAHPPPQP